MMKKFLNRLSLSQKIKAGFGLLLFMLVVVLLVAWNALNKSADGFANPPGAIRDCFRLIRSTKMSDSEIFACGL